MTGDHTSAEAGGYRHPGLAEPRTKEDWFFYVDYEPPPRPVMLPYEEYLAMDEAARRRLNHPRNLYHSALVLVWTPAIRYFETEISELLLANEAAPPGARHGLLIDGPATAGKSTLVKMIARKLQRQLREDFPERFEDKIGDYVPIVYISLADEVTSKQISLALARYLNVPTSGTKDEVDHRVLLALKACGTQLIIFDDLHFLDCSRKEGRAANDHIKFLANHAACTIVGTGVDLEDSPLLSEGTRATSRERKGDQAAGRYDRNNQTSGRFSRHELPEFSLESKTGRVEWAGMVSVLESALELYQHDKGSLTRNHWRYLHERTGGSIAGLHTLIRRSAVRAVRTGAEAITREVMDSITLSYDHERGYARVLELKRKQDRRRNTRRSPGAAAGDASGA